MIPGGAGMSPFPGTDLGVYFISNGWHRLDALLYGRLEIVENTNPVVKRFHRRTGEERVKKPRSEALDQRIQEMKQNVTFGLYSGYEQGASGLPERRTVRYGSTRQDRALEEVSVQVRLGIEMLQPLLRKDLTDAER